MYMYTYIVHVYDCTSCMPWYMYMYMYMYNVRHLVKYLLRTQEVMGSNPAQGCSVVFFEKH